VPEALAVALDPALETIASLTERIRGYDRRLEALSRELYPETALLRQGGGVGPITALTFVLVLEDAARFGRSRSVGAYLGLAPGQRQSGESDPQERISKRGDELLRKLLVQGAHYVLGPFAQDSDLRRHGLKIAERGGKNAKWRAPRWRASSRCCCIGCGSPERPTSRFTTPEAHWEPTPHKEERAEG
jgi:transposase